MLYTKYLFQIVFVLALFLVSTHQQDSDDYSNEEYEDEPSNVSAKKIEKSSEKSTFIDTMVKIVASKSLNQYRKLQVNDMILNINDESSAEALNIKAYYRDEIQYECEFPPEEIAVSEMDWLVNGQRIGLNESVYTIVLDKKIDPSNKSSFLNVSCLVRLSDQPGFLSISFPLINLGKNLLKMYSL
jgi:hypothetical protein